VQNAHILLTTRAVTQTGRTGNSSELFMFAAQLTLRVTLAWYDTGRLPGFTAYLRLAKLMILYKIQSVSATTVNVLR
jgi:hypothetical protein